SYQLIYILFSAIGIFVVSIFSYELISSMGMGKYASLVGGLIAGLSLALYPLFFSDTHTNLKDPAVASLFAGCVWAFWHWVKEGRRKWDLVFFGFFLCALGIKWNILFLPFILLPWLVSIRHTLEFKKWFHKKLLLHSFLFLLFSLFFL